MDLCFWILCIVLLCLVIAIVYCNLTETHGFWKKQNVPFVPPNLVVGSANWTTVNQPLQVTESQWYNHYGRVYGRFESQRPVLSVGDPEILKYILTKDFNYFPNRRDMKFHDQVMDNTLFVLEGDDWDRVRKIVNPGFNVKKIKAMVPLLNECCDLLLDWFSETTDRTEGVHCQDFYERFFLSSVGRCAFGMNINAIRSPKNVFIEKSKKLFQENLGWRSCLTIQWPSLMKFFRLNLLNPETTSFYRETIIDVIEQRKKLNVHKDDFLSHLTEAEDANNNGAGAICEEGSCPVDKKPKPEKPRLSHDEMLSQCVTFFIAGFDATTSLLSHVTYRLAMHQDYQEMVVEELDRALSNHNGEMSYDVVSEMKFLDAMMHECLRMCPAMVRHERRAGKDYYIKSRNIHLRKETLVSIPVFAMHHDPEWYPEPEVFNPERFYPDNLRIVNRYNYLPFGNGNRMCIGMRFVQIQVKLCIAKLLMKFQVLPAPSTPQTLEYTENRNVLTVNKVEVCLRERQLF